ncbi:hypothetical protein [Capnocytophaga sp.]|uniref:hypothetical protein n=1 Tax=Capnocytophaga sp. TaxID=44737 RepID=UPI0026DB790C|nr:hypothetical protein [Capnocytophaga sp.]
MAEKFGIKASKLSEILNERMNVGVDLLSILTDDYNINAEWLLTGKPPMLKNEQNQPVAGPVNDNEVVALLKENNATLKAQLKDKEEKEALYKEKITKLEADIQALKSAQSMRVNQSNQPNQPRPSV